MGIRDGLFVSGTSLGQWDISGKFATKPEQERFSQRRKAKTQSKDAKAAKKYLPEQRATSSYMGLLWVCFAE